MRPLRDKKWPLLGGAALYKLLAHQVIEAIYQGRLPWLFSFRHRASLPLANYTELADRIFFGYLWLAPLGARRSNTPTGCYSLNHSCSLAIRAGVVFSVRLMASFLRKVPCHFW